MTGCRDDLIRHVATQGVAVSVGVGTATTTRYGHGETIRWSGEPPHSVATTRAIGGGARSSSLVILSVRCAEPEPRR